MSYVPVYLMAVARRRSLSIFLYESEKLATNLHQRTLLFGALYRVGFQLVFFMLVTLVVVPVALQLTSQMMETSRYGTSDPLRLAIIAAGLAVVAAVSGLRTFKPAATEDRLKVRNVIALRELAPKGVRMPVVLILFFGSVGWLAGWGFATGANIGLVDFPRIPTLGRWVVAGGSGFALATWGLLRLVGPLGQWWEFVRTPHARKPDQPHSGSQIDSLDAALVLGPLVSIYLTGSQLSISQVAVLSGLAAVALWVSHLRKFERQLHGIYRNQRDWIDSNLAYLVSRYQMGGGESLPEEQNEGETSKASSTDRRLIALAVVVIIGLRVRKWLVRCRRV